VSFSKRLLVVAVSVTTLAIVVFALSQTVLLEAFQGVVAEDSLSSPADSALTESPALKVSAASSSAESSRLHSGLAGAKGDQAYFDDLDVDAGEVIEGNVIIYAGEARIRDGGRIDGDLVVYSGDVHVYSGGSVDGSVSAFSGDVTVAGYIGADLTVWSGNVELESGAFVEGDISVLNGDVKRAPGAEVGGNVVKGPKLNLPPAPPSPFKFGVPFPPGENRIVGAGLGPVQWLAAFILRLMGAILISLLVGLVAWLIAQVRPSTLQTTHAVMLEQPALSFVIGILANAFLLLAAAFFAVTVCLLPLSFASILLAIVLNLAGWAVISSVVSQSVMERFGWSMRWDYALGITAAVLAAGIGLLWAMGSCFRFFGFAGLLIVSSIGAGAFLLPYIRNRTRDAETALPETSSTARTEDVVAVEGEDTRTAEIEAEEAMEVTEPETGSQVDTGRDEEPETQSTSDDFTQIRGLGPVAAGRLTSAGVMSFADLSQMTPEQIGEMLRWSPDRVRQTGIIAQAAGLAGTDA
jgi:predicted flap endonuclease-1-like 5' DNA nuclease/cytoskeletal protein CcmA (bactofilin family)